MDESEEEGERPRARAFMALPALAGLFLVSASALGLEITLLRLLSLSQSYHFASLVVGIAMFGLALSGTWASLLEGRRDWAGLDVRRGPWVPGLLFAACAAAGPTVALEFLSFDPYQATLHPWALARLPLYYVFLGAPFFFYGLLVAASLRRWPRQSGPIYAANLGGSAAGVGGAVGLGWLEPWWALGILCTLGLLGAWLTGRPESARTGRRTADGRENLALAATAAVVLAALIVYQHRGERISEYKDLPRALAFPGAQRLATLRSGHARADAVRSPLARYAPGLSPRFRGALPPQIGVTVDGAGMNGITGPGDRRFTEYLPSAVALGVAGGRRACVLNAGAGLDVEAALHHGYRVQAWESEVAVLRLVGEVFGDFSDGLYIRRALVRQGVGRREAAEEGPYDVLIVSSAGSLTANATGLGGASENYLFTVEGIAALSAALSPGGLLSITRPLDFPPRETLKLLALAQEQEDGLQRSALFRSWTTITLLLASRPMAATLGAQIARRVDDLAFDLVYLPFPFQPDRHSRFSDPLFGEAVREMLRDPRGFASGYLFQVAAATDDRPFHFHFFRPSRFPDLYRQAGERWQPFLDSGFLLTLLIVQALLFSALAILLPALGGISGPRPRIARHPLDRAGKERTASPPDLDPRRGKPGPLKLHSYFGLLGLAYMLVEMAWIQKMVLYLDTIEHAAALVVGSLLLLSGGGSLALRGGDRRGPAVRAALAGALVLLSLPLLECLMDRIAGGWSIAGVAAFLLAGGPAAFAMGLPFPAGLSSCPPGRIAWVWAVNGSASVIAAAGAAALALYAGYTAVLLLAGGLYLLAAVCGRGWTGSPAA